MNITQTPFPGHRTVLVVGASGRQGNAVARELLHAGHRVKAMTRRPGSIPDLVQEGAEPVIADLEVTDSLRAALTGVDAVFAVNTFTGPDGVVGELRQGRNLASAASRVGVKHVVYSSVGAAEAADLVPHFASKVQIEHAWRSTGIPLTVLRPAFFMDNFLDFSVSISDETTVDVALALPADRPLQMVATMDIAQVAVAAFNDPERFVSEVIELAGDELTGPQIAATIGHHLGRVGRYIPLPLQAVTAHSAEMGAMFRFLTDHGYTADISSLRGRFPALHDLSNWLRAVDFDLSSDEPIQ